MPEFAAELAIALGQRVENPLKRSLFIGISSALHEDLNPKDEDRLRSEGVVSKGD